MKILFTTPVIEHPPAGGPNLRIENSIIALNKVSELHVISRLNQIMIGGREAEDFFKQYCNKFLYVPSVLPENKLIKKLRRIVLGKKKCNNSDKLTEKDAKFIINYAKRNKINIIWFGYGNISYNLMKKIKELNPEFKIVCDTDSVWSRFILRELPYEKDEKRKIQIKKEGKLKEQEEADWIKWCDVTTAVSEVDADYYKSLTDDKDRIKIFSNVINLDTYKNKPLPPVDFKNPCIYLAGTFWSQSPMEKAARWIIEEVIPIIRKTYPDIHLYIIGQGSDNILSDVKDKNITITGKLLSVLPYLYNSDVSLVPLMFESGTRFKILEAAACEIPITSTTLGAEGINITHGENIIIADEPEEFADAVLKILNNKDFAKQIATNCKKLIQKNYSIEKLADEAKEIIEYLTQKGS